VSWQGPKVYGVRDFFSAATRQRVELEEELKRIDTEGQLHLQNRATLGEQATAARRDLAQSLLPGLLPELVARARDLTGFAPWRTEDPIAAMERDRADTLRRLAQIEADRMFVESELLFHPRTGTHPRELAELEAHHATQVAALQQLMAHPRFVQLVEWGYGTEKYTVPFWRLSYYDDWQAHDQIVEAFPGKTFQDLAKAYVEALDAEETLRGEMARVRGVIAQGRAVWDEHAALKRRLEVLPGTHLQSAQVRLLEHVMTSHGPSMRAALARDPALHNLYLRASALDAKLRYLDHLHQQQVVPLRESIHAALDKLSRDVWKYERPKKAYHTFPAESFERRFTDRTHARHKRWTRYRERYAGIYGWDRWDDVPDDDFVWWDVMADGRPDGDVLPDVADYRRRHGRPTWLDDPSRHRRSTDTRDDDLAEIEAAAASSGFAGGAGGGRSSFAGHDPS
jgi:hypothetical protein